MGFFKFIIPRRLLPTKGNRKSLFIVEKSRQTPGPRRAGARGTTASISTFLAELLFSSQLYHIFGPVKVKFSLANRVGTYLTALSSDLPRYAESWGRADRWIFHLDSGELKLASFLHHVKFITFASRTIRIVVVFSLLI